MLFLKLDTILDTKKSVKALLMNANNELVVFFVRGDRELNLNKACKLLGVKEINFADDNLIKTSNAVAGYTGPINLNAKIVVDREVLEMKNSRFFTGNGIMPVHERGTMLFVDKIGVFFLGDRLKRSKFAR